MGNEDFLKAPKDRKFYKNMANFMFICGLASQEWYWYRVPKFKIFYFQRFVVIFCEPLGTWSQLLYIYLKFNELTVSELSSMITITAVCAMIMIKIFIAQTPNSKKAMRDYMSKIHLYNIYEKDPSNEFVKQTLKTVEWYNRLTFLGLTACCFICTSAWLVVPTRYNIINNPDPKNITVRLEIVTNWWLPFDYEYILWRWCIVQVCAFYGCYSAIGVMFTFDSLNLACIYHLIGHLKIFKNKFKTRFVKNLSQEDLKLLLTELSTDYNFIKASFKTFESAFGLNIVGIYGQNLLEGCIILFILSTGDLTPEVLLTYGLLIPSLQGLLILLSYTLEYLRALTEEIPDLVYDLQWEDMSLSNKKMIQMLLFQVQPVLEFKAAMNLKTGIQPAVNILKTTFTYYVIIKAKAS